MLFGSIRNPLTDREYYIRQIAGRWESLDFGYTLAASPTAEGIAVDSDSGMPITFLNYWREVEAGTAEGFHAIQARGIRLCSVGLVLRDPQLRNVSNPYRHIRNGMRRFVRERVVPLLTPIKPLHADWLTSDVVSLARGIHTNAALDGIPALTDALIEADCDHPLVMEHLRTCPDHGPSCWVVEMILDAESQRHSSG